MAAVLAMMGGRDGKLPPEQEASVHSDIEAGNASVHSQRHAITSSGASNAPGDDRVSLHGAENPEKAVGREVSVGSENATEESKDSATRNQYASEIIMRGLNKEGWKLVITGHSLGAGAAALIALKLKDRYPEVKCWAYCPPGGLLTPNMAHAMKPFCTSVVVNKDCIPRMSLKNLNRFMEGKLMALACSRLNAFQIFWASYGKVNRRRFFDNDIFRPLDEMPKEARDMLERFQECTLTDVSAQDMVPPGRVMFLRRFKASPNASPLKQEQHRRRANSLLPKANSSFSNLKRLASSGSDSSGSDSAFRKLKRKISSSSDGDNSHHRQQTRDESVADAHADDKTTGSQQTSQQQPARKSVRPGAQFQGQQTSAQAEGRLSSLDSQRGQQQSLKVNSQPGQQQVQSNSQLQEKQQQEQQYEAPPLHHQRRSLLEVPSGGQQHMNGVPNSTLDHSRQSLGYHSYGDTAQQSPDQSQGHLQADSQGQGPFQEQPHQLSHGHNQGQLPPTGPIPDQDALNQVEHQQENQSSDSALLQSDPDSCQQHHHQSEHNHLLLQEQTLQQLEQEEEDYYHHAGLQKPETPTADEADVGSSWDLKRYKHRRRRKKNLHESLVNPTDLFWDAVWIEPEDIIREGLLVSPRMTEDHYTTSLLRSLKAVSERLASQEGKAGKETTQGSTQVAAADQDSEGSGKKGRNQSGGVKEATLGGVFDLV